MVWVIVLLVVIIIIIIIIACVAASKPKCRPPPPRRYYESTDINDYIEGYTSMSPKNKAESYKKLLVEGF